MNDEFYKAIVFDPAEEGRRFVDFVHMNDRRRGSLSKTAAEREYSPEIMHHVRNLQPRPGKTYPLISALGAGEYWGSNSNADYFSHSELVPADGCTDYGYKSFERFARPYKHHINKPDSPAYGEVLHSVYNPRMHRVELLVCLDDRSAPDIAERVHDGEDVPVSMGCKVPYDVCSICEQKARSTDEYCDHMKLAPNQVLSDGRKVFVFNIRPRFFDISFVFVGADRTARVMAKAASARTLFAVKYPSGLWAMKMGYHLKGADLDKGADIIKEVSGQATDALAVKSQDVARGVQALASTEKPIGTDALAKIAAACGGDYNSGLATLTQSGVVLSPREFQSFMGMTMFRQDKVAQELCKGPVFTENSYDTELYEKAASAYDLSVASTSPSVAQAVAPLLEDRSAFHPFLGNRLEAALASGPTPASAPPVDQSVVPLLGSLAALYAAYRDKIPATQMGPLDKLVAKNPALIALLAGLTAGGVLGVNHLAGASDYTKAGSEKRAFLGSTLGRILGVPAMAYLYSGHQQRRRWRGEELGPVDSFMADYPWAAAAMGIHGAGRLNELASLPKMASVVSTVRHDQLRSCGNLGLMDYKATLDLLVLADRPV